MIDCAYEALNAQCAAVILCGRNEPGFTCVPDRPGPDLGPLGGLNTALHYAADKGFTHVLSAGVDTPDLPRDLAQTLSGDETDHTPAIVQSQPVIGLWPADMAHTLDAFLSEGERALYGFARAVHARRIAFDPPLMNVNRPSDLP